MIKKIKTLSILLLFVFQMRAIDVDCKIYYLGETRKINYENSDVIFLGIPVVIENNKCKFLILEEFKGKIPRSITVIFYKPIESKDLFSLWLIYGNKKYDDIYVTECSLSRSINKPAVLCLDQSLPPPVCENEKTDDKIFRLNEYLNQLYKLQWRDEFYDEIKILQALKKSESTQAEHNNNILKHIDKYIVYIVLLFLLLLNIYLCVKIHKITKRYHA
jgi:hypothetical protein